MKAQRFVRFIIKKYPVMYRDFKRFLISDIIPKLPANRNIKMTQRDWDEVLDLLYDVMENRIYNREKANLITSIICRYVKF